jgi:protein-tyrosine-phosphatase
VREDIRRLRAAAAAAVHLPERVLHPVRRARATRRMAGLGPVSRALFICHGNVCRSPFAAAVFGQRAERRLPQKISVTSAGFIGPGRQPPDSALRAASRYGIESSAHRSSLIDAESARRSDLVVVMDRRQAEAMHQRFGVARRAIVILGDLDPAAVTRRTIRDPWGCDDTIFDASFARIIRCVDALIDTLAGQTRH